MKKEVNLIISTYRAILADYSSHAGTVGDQIELSVSQIRELITSRGVRVVFTDFPSAGKMIDESLSSQVIKLSELRKVFGKMPGTNLPRIFNFLFRKLYTEDGHLLSDLDPIDILFIRQLTLMFKKIVRPCARDLVDEAIESFGTLDRHVGKYHPGTFPVWKELYSRSIAPLAFSQVPYSPLFTDGTSLEDAILRIRDKQMGLFSFDLEEEDSSWSAYTQFMGYVKHGKFDVPLKEILGDYENGLLVNPMGEISCKPVDTMIEVFARTARLIITRFEALAPEDLKPCHGTGPVSGMAWGDKYSFPDWSSKLESYFQASDFGMLNHRCRPSGSFRDIDIPVKVLAVPKTLKGPRIIGAESVARMFCQQALRGWMRDQIPHVTMGSVMINDQTKSQRMALEGSKNGDYATIDLSSASDRLSCSLVEEVFSAHPELLKALSACRADTYVLDSDRDPEVMHKFSHQGSAVTFPVQSLCYYALRVAACFCQRGITMPRQRDLEMVSQDICVYGDDIIVPVDVYDTAHFFLHMWGLKVNVSKSHKTGFFRESCGMDAYRGFDVTPVYIRDLSYEVQKPESVIRFVEVGNNLHKAGFWHASCGLFSAEGLNVPTTPAEQVPLARFTFSPGCHTRDLHVRWNQELHLHEMKTLVPSTKGSKEARDGYESILQYILEGPDTPEDPDYHLKQMFDDMTVAWGSVEWNVSALNSTNEPDYWASGFYKDRPKPSLQMSWTQIPESDRFVSD